MTLKIDYPRSFTRKQAILYFQLENENAFGEIPPHTTHVKNDPLLLTPGPMIGHTIDRRTLPSLVRWGMLS